MSVGDSYQLNGQVRVSDAESREHEPELLAKRFTEIPSNMQMRADYGTRTDGQPDYIGYAPRGLSESSSGWLLHYYTYDSSGQCTSRLIAYDSWSNKSTASYA